MCRFKTDSSDRFRFRFDISELIERRGLEACVREGSRPGESHTLGKKGPWLENHLGASLCGQGGIFQVGKDFPPSQKIPKPLRAKDCPHLPKKNTKPRKARAQRQLSTLRTGDHKGLPSCGDFLMVNRGPLKLPLWQRKIQHNMGT